MTKLFVIAALTAVSMGQSFAEAQEFIDDEPHVQERVAALSRGEGSLKGFRIELMDGSGIAHTNYLIGDGEIESRAWERPGAEEKRTARPVSEAEVRDLLRELVAKEYWTFQGTRFVPDAPTFILRLWAGVRYADYFCDTTELEQSPHRVAIRSLLLNFVGGRNPTN